jgi:hypothetical protein
VSYHDDFAINRKIRLSVLIHSPSNKSWARWNSLLDCVSEEAATHTYNSSGQREEEESEEFAVMK